MIFDGKYVLGEVSGLTNHKNGLQVGPEEGQGGARRSQEGPKEAPSRPQGGPKGSPKEPNRAKGRLKLSLGDIFEQFFNDI